jgi:beta-glucanase (GH16 family)
MIGRRGAVLLAACVAAQTAGADLPELVRGGAADPGDWLVSDWDAGQSTRLRWHPRNVYVEDGTLRLRLDWAPDGAARPLRGAEIQSGGVAREGTWTWRVKAPEMVPGAVFGLFLYQANYRKDPWREYDIEFVGADTTRIQLNVHFETEDGRHVSLDQARGGPVVVDLGFDAAEGFHDYSITVAPDEAVFRVDGEVVGRFGPEDMPERTWSPGRLRSFVDLWAVAPGQESWAGRWGWPGRPLVAELQDAAVPR